MLSRFGPRNCGQMAPSVVSADFCCRPRVEGLRSSTLDSDGLGSAAPSISSVFGADGACVDDEASLRAMTFRAIREDTVKSVTRIPGFKSLSDASLPSSVSSALRDNSNVLSTLREETLTTRRGGDAEAETSVPLTTAARAGAQPKTKTSETAKSRRRHFGIVALTSMDGREHSFVRAIVTGTRSSDQSLRCRILERMRRFFLPIFRRPFPVLFVPIESRLLDLT